MKTRFTHLIALALTLLCPFLVMSQTVEVTIGTLDASQNHTIPQQSSLMPIPIFFQEYSSGAILYPTSTLLDVGLPSGASINRISFWIASPAVSSLNAPTNLEMRFKNSTDANLTSPSSQASLTSGSANVFSGNIQVPLNGTSNNWMDLNLNSSFTYNGDGLLILSQTSTPNNFPSPFPTYLQNATFGLDTGLGGVFSLGSISNPFPQDQLTSQGNGTRPYIKLNYTPCISDNNVFLNSTSPTACLGETVNLSAFGGGTIFWYSDDKGQNQLGSGNNYTTDPITGPTTFYYRAQSGTCHSHLFPVTVNLETTPATPTGIGQTICIAAQATLTAAGSTGNYNWYSDANGQVTIAFGTATYTTNVLNATTTFYVAAIDNNTGCRSQLVPVDATVEIDVPEPVPVSSDVDVCDGETGTLMVMAQGQNAFQWFSDIGGNNQVGTGQSFVTPVITTSQTFYVRAVTPNNCSSDLVAVNANLADFLTSPTVDPVTICEGDSAVITAISGGAGGTFQWFDDALGMNQIATSNPYQPGALNANTTYYLKEVLGGCESQLVQVDVAVTTIVNPIASDTSVCSGTTATLEATAPGSIMWYDDLMQTTLLSTGSTFTTPNIIGDSTYYVAQMENGCLSDLLPVQVGADPIPSTPALTGATICSGDSVNLSGVSDLGSTISWFSDPGASNLLFQGNSFNTGPLTSATTFYSKASLGVCESAISMVDVVINQLPASPVASGQEICDGNPAILTAASGGANGTILWYATEEPVNVLQNGTMYTSPNLNANTTFYVRELDIPTGCLSEATSVDVTIAPPLPIPQIFSEVVCDGDTASLMAFTGGTNGDYVWFSDINGNNQLFQGNPFNTPPLTQNTSYWVSETDGACFSDLVKVDVIVQPNPADPTVSDVTICSGEDALLTGVSGGSNGSLGWFSDDQGLNQIASANPLTLSALTTDTTIFLVESVGDCRSNPVPVTVTVEPNPANPTAASVAVCVGQPATLTAVSGGAGGSFAWYGDPSGVDLLTSGGSVTLNDLNENTSVWLQETSGNCSSELVKIDITVNPNPVNPVGMAATICQGDTAVLTAFSTIGTINWYSQADSGIDTLSVGDTLNTDILQQTTAFYIQETSAAGCMSGFVQVNANVNPTPPLPTVATAVEEVCEDGTAVLSAMTIANATYNWTGPANFVSNSQTPEIVNASLANAGPYSVTATIAGCVSPADTTVLVVNEKPSVGDGTVGSNSPICEGNSLQLFAPTIPNVSYQWTYPNGTVVNAQNPSVTNVLEEDDQGFYNLVITDINTGCESDVISVLVMIFNVPEDIQASNDSPACEGESVRLNASTYFGASYEWTGPGGNVIANEQSPILTDVTVADAGTYIVTITTEDGCVITQMGETNVRINQNPTADAGPDQTITEDLTAQLAASGGVSYQWSPLEFLNNGNLPNPIVDAPVGNYTYTVTVINQAGCSDSDSLNLIVLPQTELDITNVFTPNNDGVNDTWTVNFIQNLEEYTLIVFNRGGYKVLESTQYLNDWAGTYNGSDLPDGTYWYVIRTPEREYKGAVTLKR